MQKTRRRYVVRSEINIIPFLDILLILLIIFMIIPFKFIQGFEINLPNSTETINIISDNKSLLTIEIIKSGLYNIIFHDEYIRNIYLAQLNLEIRNKINMNPNIVCLLAASKDIKYDVVIEVLDLLSNIGVQSVGMITHSVPLN